MNPTPGCRQLPIIALLLLCGASTLMAQTPHKPEPGGEKAQDPTYDRIVDDPKLPRVLLIGDSISVGYTLPARKYLQGKANVHRIPANGGPTVNGIAHLDEWLGSGDDGKWDLIHFNFGLHDLKIDKDGKHQVEPEQYEANLRTIVARLKKTGAKLIWASTTPVPEGKQNPVRQTADAIKYNEIAAKVMKDEGIEINDLYAFALPQLKKIQQPVNVHFTPDGSDILGKEVASKIAAALPPR